MHFIGRRRIGGNVGAFGILSAGTAALTGAAVLVVSVDAGEQTAQIEDGRVAERLCRGVLPATLVPADATLFGHFPYASASPGSLVAPPRGFAGSGCHLIHREASDALRALLAAARAEEGHVGRDVMGLSCHRSAGRQAGLFCQRTQIARRGYAGHARWVAPPGFSEHATGLVIDFGSRSATGCNLEPCFAGTRTGRWLADNAGRFGFEMSFREGNAQGVVFEPWHFRFVGTPQARAAFAHARAIDATEGRLIARFSEESAVLGVNLTNMSQIEE